jgi:hypothetical protein
VIDLDPNNISGPELFDALNDLDLATNYSTTWPQDLDMYKSVFVSLGIIFTGHQLTNAESDKLIQYLNNGGNLYLEGRRTWYDDPPRAIHNRFNIGVVVDSWFQFDTLVGVNATFTEGMHFTYDGVTPLNDYYLVPEGNAFSVMTGTDPDHAYVIAYDEGSYKTIGCSFEFGSLEDDELPSTKERLMYEYLNFFGDIITNLEDYDDHDLSASIDNMYPNPFTDQTSITFSVKDDMMVSLDVYSIEGKKVATLVNSRMAAGKHTVNWDGNDLNGNSLKRGIYLCTLKTNSVITTKKLIRY